MIRSAFYRALAAVAALALGAAAPTSHAQSDSRVDGIIDKIISNQQTGTKLSKQMLERQRVFEKELRDIQDKLRGNNGLIAEDSFEQLDGLYNKNQVVEILKKVRYAANQQTAFRKAMIDYLCEIEQCSKKELLEKLERDARRQMALKPAPAPIPQVTEEPGFHEVLGAVQRCIQEDPRIGDICTFKTLYPEYQRIIDGLTRTQKLTALGTAICFPSKVTWDSRPRMRAQLIRILRNEGILPKNHTAVVNNAPAQALTYKQVKTAAFGYTRQLEVDVCGLKELIPGYEALVDTLDKSEKLVIYGFPICFPSETTWNTKPSFRQDLIRVLRNFDVL